MARLRDDFRAGAPVSQVPASWFNAVAKFVNGLVPGRGIRITRGAESSVIELADEADDIPSSSAGTPADHADANADDDTAAETWNWAAGGANGLRLDVYCEVAESDGWHYLQRCRLTFSRDGLLRKAEKLAGRRKIRA